MSKIDLNKLKYSYGKFYIKGKSHAMEELSRITENAPENLDTLSEIAEAFADIQEQLNGKQQEITESNKLDYSLLKNTPDISEAQIQADWGQTNNQSTDYIKNKPTNLSDFNNDTGYLTQDDLAPVAATGDYNDLVNKPDIQELNHVFLTQEMYDSLESYDDNTLYFIINSNVEWAFGDNFPMELSGIDYDLEEKLAIIRQLKRELANVAISGSYNDLNNKPTIPTAVSQLDNDAGYINSHQDISGKANSADLAIVATSGDYDDLINKPAQLSQFNNDVPYITDAQMKVEVIDANGHNYVDLGLPSGTLWATCNVGANSETEYGDYYMYGKGNQQYNSGNGIYNGTESPLDYVKDTARQVMGSTWHSPTKEQVEELIANTTYSWETNFNNTGINGAKFTAQNNSYVFFPAAGNYVNGSLVNNGNNMFVWTSTSTGSTYSYYINKNGLKQDGYRGCGFSVRGVIEPTLAPKYATKQELSALEADMNIKISSAYHHAGTKTASQLVSTLLVEEHEGEVYNITEAGTTTADFLEGIGIPIDVGANVGIAKVINGNSVSYKFDLLSGIIDTSGFISKSSTAGLMKNDGTVDTNTYLTQHQDISNYVQKSNTVGLLKNDGTIDTNTYLTQHQDISNCISSNTIRNVVVCTQSEYDTLVANNTISADTEYNIIEQI